jgi:hypothetical protein
MTEEPRPHTWWADMLALAALCAAAAFAIWIAIVMLG